MVFGIRGLGIEGLGCKVYGLTGFGRQGRLGVKDLGLTWGSELPKTGSPDLNPKP